MNKQFAVLTRRFGAQRALFAPWRTIARAGVVGLMLCLSAGCGGMPEDGRDDPNQPPPGEKPPPPPGATPTPTSPPDGEGRLTLQGPTTGVVSFNEEAGPYQVTVQISSESLGLGFVEGDGGRYSLEPLIVETKDAE